MDKAELLQFLRDNLTIDADIDRGWYGDESVRISLKLDGDVISYTSVNLPNCDKSSPYG